MSNEMEGKVWNGRKGVWEDKAAAETQRQASLAESLAKAFDPRTEISADAQHIAGRIVKHLWIIFVLLPVVLGVLFLILRA
ncbi:MAG: hypothetical protein ACLQLC_01825 [Candidatus Sulfotelmatobacter sp.]